MNINDSFNFLSKLTFRRIANATKIVASYFWSKWTGKAVEWGLPVTISFEPTTACNLRCPECPSGLRAFTRPTGNLSTDFFKKTINEISDELIYLIFYFQGEPYINPDFLNMVQYASQKGIYTITSTNAHFLDDKNAQKTIVSGLDRLIISIDGTTQEVYQNYRKEGELSKVLEGARNIIAWKKKMQSRTPHVIFQFLVVRPNEHQIEEVKKLAEDIGVDKVVFKSAQVYDFENGNPLIPTIEKYARYRQKADGSYEIKNKLLNHCWKLWHSCVITWDGMVVPCCFDKDASHQLGDLKEHNFSTIWQNGNYRAFRKKILKGRKEIDICRNCTEGTKLG